MAPADNILERKAQIHDIMLFERYYDIPETALQIADIVFTERVRNQCEADKIVTYLLQIGMEF